METVTAILETRLADLQHLLFLLHEVLQEKVDLVEEARGAVKVQQAPVGEVVGAVAAKVKAKLALIAHC
jgi:hypothetical protein